MTQGKLRLDLVAVPPPLSLPQHVALFDQLGQDPVGGPLRDPYRGGYVARADARAMSPHVGTWAWLVRKSQLAAGDDRCC
jgi:hypothetical protein